MIFKQGSCEQELLEGMEKAQLEAVAEEGNKTHQLFLEAMQELNAAAESFEKAGRVSRAKEVTQVMMSLADDDSDEETEKSDKDEVEKVFMFFGFGPDDLKGLKG